MLVVRCRSSRRTAAWNSPPTQNCTGVVRSHRSRGFRSHPGAHGKSSVMLPSSTGTARSAPTTSFTRSRAISRARSAWSRSRLSGVTSICSGIVYPAAATAARSWSSAAGSGPSSTRARSVARLTAASVTPGTDRSARSTLPTQAAQCMPFTGRSRRGASDVFGLTRASLSPGEPGEDVEQLVELPLAVPRAAGAHRVRHARLEMLAEQELLDLLDRPLDRGELEQDVHAVLVLLHHPLDALDLALDAAQATERLPLRLIVHHGVSVSDRLSIPEHREHRVAGQRGQHVFEGVSADHAGRREDPRGRELGQLR